MHLGRPLIVGAGPAGCAAAIVLAREGAQPMVLERLSATGDALCGGFLSWQTLEALRSIGVTGLRGHPIDTMRLFSGKHYAEARLPQAAMGLSRHRLDTVMQAKATATGAEIAFGTTVREVAQTHVRTDTGDIDTGTLFVATGKHDVRGLTRDRDGDATLGLRVKLDAHPRLHALLDGAIELHLFDRGYVGLLLQEDGRANLCLAVRKSKLMEAGGKPARLLEAIACGTPLEERLAFMTSAPGIDAIAAVPYGWRTPDTTPGVFRLGDQAAVIPSLAGEGIGIAVASGIAAAKAWNTGGAAQAVAWQRQFFSRTRRPVTVAKFLWERAESPWSAALGIGMARAMPQAARLLALATRIDAG